jgi:hypothetical protein
MADKRRSLHIDAMRILGARHKICIRFAEAATRAASMSIHLGQNAKGSPRAFLDRFIAIADKTTRDKRPVARLGRPIELIEIGVLQRVLVLGPAEPAADLDIL